MQQVHSSTILNITRWLPLHLQQVEDYGQALRMRIFLLLILLCIVPLVLLLPFVYGLLLTDIATFWQPTLILTLVVAAQSANLAWFLKSGDIDLCALLYSIMIFALVSAAVILTGGWASPVCKLLLAIPLITCLVASRFTGLMISLAALVLYSVLFLLARQHYEFRQFIPADYLALAHIGMWFTTLFFLVGCLLLFDFSTDDLSQVIQDERRQWQEDLDLDELTRCLNAGKLKDLAASIAAARATRSAPGELGLIYIQVAKLKELNSDFGLEAGDLLLKSLAERLRRLATTGNCYLSRYYPDTFVLLLPHTDSSEFISLLGKVSASLCQPLVLMDQLRICPHCPLGAVLSTQQQIQLEELLATAQQHLSARTADKPVNTSYVRLGDTP